MGRVRKALNWMTAPGGNRSYSLVRYESSREERARRAREDLDEQNGLLEPRAVSRSEAEASGKTAIVRAVDEQYRLLEPLTGEQRRRRRRGLWDDRQ
jgi:hypothetical protein